MKLKLILSLLTLSLLPAQICAFFDSTQTMQHELTLSKDFAKNMGEVLKESGDQLNENVSAFTKHLGDGLETNVAPGIAALGKGGADALKNVRPGLVELGEGFADGIKPVQNQLLIGVVTWSALSLAATALGIIAKKY